MKGKIIWPDGHDFAFTIVDDTDEATVENVGPVYEYLLSRGLKTTKTCWVYPSREKAVSGQCLQDGNYTAFLLDIQSRGTELAFHNAGSGAFRREETLAALEEYRNKLGQYPSLHVNHRKNRENLYWGKDRFSGLIRFLYGFKQKQRKYEGSVEDSEYFWGDFAKEHIKYIRNRTFNGLDTLKEDPRLVYREKRKQKYSNYWFSSSDGIDRAAFVKLLSKENVDKLVRNHGCAVVYTHFAYGFVDENGELSEDFRQVIDYLSSRNGWFVPAGQLLDYVAADRDVRPSGLYEALMDVKWFFQRIRK